MIDVNKKIMEAMKAHDKVASETFKLVKAKILEFKTAKNAKEYDEAAEINLIRKMIQESQDSACIYLQNIIFKIIVKTLLMMNMHKLKFLILCFHHYQLKMILKNILMKIIQME